MTWNTLTKPQLIEAGNAFGTDLEMGMSKPDMIAALETDGVDYGAYVKAIEATTDPDEIELALLDDASLDEEEEENSGQEFTEVVKMERRNFTYEVRGYRFTRDHPYALVTEEDAEYLIETGGFRPATKKEISEYYADA